MADVTADLADFVSLYRFASILTGRSDSARSLVKESVEEVLARTKRRPDPSRLCLSLFSSLRKRCLKVSPGRMGSPPRGRVTPDLVEVVSRNDSAAVRRAMAGLCEPGRSALALLYLGIFEMDDLQRLFGLSVSELAQALEGARLELASACQTAAARTNGRLDS